MTEQENVRLEHLAAELEGFATVADADHLHYEPVVMNFVDDPVVPGAHPVHIRFTDQSDAFVRSRFAGKKVDDRPNPLLIIAR
jgi:hypothetical protein